MTVIDMQEAAQAAYVDREYAKWSALQAEFSKALHGAIANPEYAEIIIPALIMIAGIQACDEMRLKVAGYAPQPLQNILARERLISAELVADMKRNHQEARH